MALGPYPLISLVLAREKQADRRRLILEGINPAEKRREEAGWRAPLYVRVRGARMGASNIIWSAEHSTALFSELTGSNIALNAIQSGSRASGTCYVTGNPLLVQL